MDQFVARRREIAKIYDQELNGNQYFETISPPPNSNSVYHLYPLLLRDEYMNFKKVIFMKLKELGLGVQVHYMPVYFHPYYQKLGFKKGLCPLAEQFYIKEISIPMFPGLTDEQISEVCQILNSFELN